MSSWMDGLVASYCPDTGRPLIECRCDVCTPPPATQRTPEPVAPLPCKLAYYGLPCTGCDKHPRGITPEQARLLRAAER